MRSEADSVGSRPAFAAAMAWLCPQGGLVPQASANSSTPCARSRLVAVNSTAPAGCSSRLCQGVPRARRGAVIRTHEDTSPECAWFRRPGISHASAVALAGRRGGYKVTSATLRETAARCRSTAESPTPAWSAAWLTLIPSAARSSASLMRRSRSGRFEIVYCSRVLA